MARWFGRKSCQSTGSDCHSPGCFVFFLLRMVFLSKCFPNVRPGSRIPRISPLDTRVMVQYTRACIPHAPSLHIPPSFTIRAFLVSSRMFDSRMTRGIQPSCGTLRHSFVHPQAFVLSSGLGLMQCRYHQGGNLLAIHRVSYVRIRFVRLVDVRVQLDGRAMF